mgnify:CR=1 FL=1
MHSPVTVIGEALIDIVVRPHRSAQEHVGGSPLNVAVGLARLGHPTQLATALGQDERGDRIAQTLRESGVDLTPGSQTAARTSTATAHLDAAGSATYEFELSWDYRAGRGDLAVGAHLHTGSIAAILRPGAEQVAAAVDAHRGRGTVSYDPNVRPALMGSPEQARPIVEAMVARADVVKASAEDAAWLYPHTPLPQVLADWARLGPAIVAVTDGADATLVLVGGELSRWPPMPVTVIDTVGAGDAFMAGLLSGLVDGGFLGATQARERLRFARLEQLTAAIERATTCAAITVSRAGANPPFREELIVHS